MPQPVKPRSSSSARAPRKDAKVEDSGSRSQPVRATTGMRLPPAAGGTKKVSSPAEDSSGPDAPHQVGETVEFFDQKSKTWIRGTVSKVERQRSCSRRSASSADGAITPADMKAYEALVEKQRTNLTCILSELQRQKRKTSCWAWWVFPTDKQGDCDPACTRVTTATAARLLNTASAPQWRQVLEKICELVEENGMGVLPRIDHGRVHWFIKFWSELDATPDWMQDVCGRLGQFPWPPR
eukprot:gnl/TRDRNA2_/TRDRNA2_198931_c0_seq1.p1 gnl/TRDRNA2_/TRDRNA2_198931_c0~~gnl/TRDRNA2_/TRDRNA2_198931_c0_seq1.p1  ORF type:complete len:239 (-),score=35.67 gnl/TRDRNA2_/TRDRNA2_198931_c0_seq1:140-856(-)